MDKPIIDKIQERMDIIDQYTRGKLRVAEVRLHPKDWLEFAELIKLHLQYDVTPAQFAGVQVKCSTNAIAGVPQLVV